MNYKSSDPKFTFRFLNHFETFIRQYDLFQKDSKLLVAVSGGIDSIAIVFAIKALVRYGYSCEVRVLHINHGTREGQIAEEKFVQDFCLSLGVECIVKTIKDLDPHRNFEYNARLKRYFELYAESIENEKIILAHHIDDSFEWSMLQILRSSSVEGLVGIPLINGQVIRPFMCVTKDQIIKFVEAYDLPFIEDPTNEQIKYERNYIRHEVVPAFKARYKKYLKHYVYRHNEIARRLGLHLTDKNKSHFNLSLSSDAVVIFSQQITTDYSGLALLIRRSMKILNPESRGTLAKQIDNIKQALKNGKQGPLSLTNSIFAYVDYNVVLLTKHTEPHEMKLVFNNYKSYTFEEYSNYLHSWLYASHSNFDFPFITLCKQSFMKSNTSKFSFNTQYIEILEQQGAQFHPALRLLREWSKKRNRDRTLKLNFLRS